MFIECFLIFNDVKFPPVLSLKTRVRSFKARFSFRGDAYSLHLRRPLYRRCVTRTLDIIVSSRSLWQCLMVISRLIGWQKHHVATKGDRVRVRFAQKPNPSLFTGLFDVSSKDSVLLSRSNEGHECSIDFNPPVRSSFSVFKSGAQVGRRIITIIICFKTSTRS